MSTLKIKIQRKIRPTEAEDKLVPQNNNLCFHLNINQITTIFVRGNYISSISLLVEHLFEGAPDLNKKTEYTEMIQNIFEGQDFGCFNLAVIEYFLN